MSRWYTASERGLFSGSLALSLGLHAALAVLVLLGGSWPPPASPPVLTVSLVAPESSQPGPGGSSGPAGAPGAPAGIKKEPATATAATLAQPVTPPSPKKKPRPKKRAAAPVPRPRPQPRQALEPLPPRPAPPPVVQKPTPWASTSSSPVASSPPGKSLGAASAGVGRTAGPGPGGTGSAAARSAVLGYGQGGQGGGNPAAAQRRYLKQVRARILAQRKYPYMARQRRQEGVVHLRFTLSPAGALSQGVQVVKPSGYNLLDEQARQCVLAAAPFPPFPLDLRRERLSVELPIIYKISELER